MKALVSIVAISVAANAGLVVAFVKQPTLAPPSLRSFFEFGSGGDAAPAAAKSAAKAAQPSATDLNAAFWARLQTADLPSLVAQLRAAGFPAAMIRALADAELQRRLRPRMEEIRQALAAVPYWRADSLYYNNTKLYEQINQFYRDRTKALRELLGQDALAYAGVDPTEAQRRQFGTMPANKIPLVQQIAEDYTEMIAQTRGAMQGITLPEDREKLAFLEQARREDLAKVLTPEELADYEMRTSQVTSRMRTTFSVMDANEAEFRAIYRAYEPHAELFFPGFSGGIIYTGMETSDQRRKVTEEINASLKQTLGEARFAEYTRANDREFQQLYQASRSENLPYDTLVRAYNTRASTGESSMRIANDTQMSPEAKMTALKQLSQETRTQILSTLGPTSGPAYIDAARWLTYLEQGRAFSVNATGNMTFRMVTPPRPAAAKKQ